MSSWQLGKQKWSWGSLQRELASPWGRQVSSLGLHIKTMVLAHEAPGWALGSTEILLCPCLLFSWAPGSVIVLSEGASSRKVPPACPSCWGCSWIWQAAGRRRVMACWEWSGLWTRMATFNLSNTEHVFRGVCDLALDCLNRWTWPFKLQVATQLAHEDLHDLF